MTNIVFEGVDEVIVCNAANVNNVIRDWFLEGGRSLDDYNIYTADGAEGFSISTGVKFKGVESEYNVVDLMPHDLREELIDAELLEDVYS